MSKAVASSQNLSFFMDISTLAGAAPLNKSEVDLLTAFLKHAKSGGDDYSLSKITRRSEKEFDFGMEGEITGNSYKPGEKMTYGFSGWFPLAVIRASLWPSYAEMSDYPEMVESGDWSGIRDSEPETIWAIFEVARKTFV
jgi:hypothetical protein